MGFLGKSKKVLCGVLVTSAFTALASVGQVNAQALDGAAGIGRVGIPIARNVEPPAQGKHRGIHGHKPALKLMPQVRGIAGNHGVSDVIGGRQHFEFFRLV